MDSRFANQNPYWTAYRNLAPDDKDRFMFNAGLTYNIFDWLSVAGRIRLDKTFMTSEHKIYASSFDYFAKSNGAYDYYDYKEHQTYIDAIANINKHFGQISLAANVGYSYSDYASLTRGYGGNLILVPNKFSLNNIARPMARYVRTVEALRYAMLLPSQVLKSAIRVCFISR